MSKGLLLAFLAVTVALTTVVFFTRRTVNQRNVSQHAESKEAIIEKAKAIIQEIKTVKNEEALALTIEKFNKNMEKISTCPEAQKLRLNFELSLGQKYRQFAEEADVLKTLPETPAALKSITSAAKYLGPLQEKALLAKPDSILLLERLQQVARHRDSEDLKIKVAVQEFDKEVAEAKALYLKNNPHMKYCNNKDHGYLVLKVSKDELIAEFNYASTVKKPEATKITEKVYHVKSGSAVLVEETKKTK